MLIFEIILALGEQFPYLNTSNVNVNRKIATGNNVSWIAFKYI